MDQQILQLSESDLLLFLNQSTTTTAANVPEEAKQKHQNSADFFDPNWPFGTNTFGNGNAKGNDDIGVLKEKVAALEAKNRFLEGKVNCMDEKAKVKESNDQTKHDITISNNKALAKMVGEFKDELREEHQRKMNELKDEFAEVLSKQNEEHQKQMAQLEVKNKASAKKVAKGRKKAEMANYQVKLNFGKIAELTKEMALLKEQQQLKQQAILQIIGKFKDEWNEENQRKMDVLKDEFAKMLSKQNESQKDLSAQICVLKKKTKVKKAVENAQMANNQLEEKVEAVQQKMAELAKEMALLKEQQHLKETISGTQMGPDLLDNLPKGKRVDNPKGNCLSLVYGGKSGNGQWQIAKKGFPLSGANCRPDNFRGTIVYYYEVTQISSSKESFYGCLSDGNISEPSWIGISPNSTSFPDGCAVCFSSGKYPFHKSEWPFPNGAIQPPQWNGQGDVIGCGLLLKPNNEQAMFFTLNGTLLGKQFPINHFGELLYPTVTMEKTVSLEANFGEDAAKSFAYDIKKCPGMVFE